MGPGGGETVGQGAAGVRYLKQKQKLMTRSPDCTMVGVSLWGR